MSGVGKRGHAVTTVAEKEAWLLDRKELWGHYQQLEFERQRKLRISLFKMMRAQGMYSLNSTSMDGSCSLFTILKRLTEYKSR